MNAIVNRTTRFIELGLIDYQKALEYQTNLFNRILAIKSENRNLPAEDQKPTNNYLIFCEHPHVFTLGRNGDDKNLRISTAALSTIGADYYATGRGGDITYHGPGQLVIYPVIDLENFFTDIHKYMRLLEESVIQTLKELNIEGERIQGLTGVWCGVKEQKNVRKIAALGVKTSRWVTLHGMAFNINTDLSYFNYIVPCGIGDKGVTSVSLETNAHHSVRKVGAIVKEKIEMLFGMSLTTE